MQSFAFIVAALLSVAVAFVPANVRSPITRGTIVMDGKSNSLKGRIKSIKNTRRITEAMRLVAAARVRRAQDAVLKTRPLIGQLQLVRRRSHVPPHFPSIRGAQVHCFVPAPHFFFNGQVFKTVLDACKQEDLELPILEVRDVKKVSLVLVTGDRGLCGGYNSAVIKQATKRINKLKEQGIEVIPHLFFYI